MKQTHMLSLGAAVAIFFAITGLFQTHIICASAAEPGAGFAFKDTPGQYLDVLLDGRLVGRYMYAYDKSTPQRLNETYKPYLHVFDAAGEAPITKGVGGQYTHHRGIFIGWNKMNFNGKNYDRWHMKGGEIVHQNFSSQKADANQAAFTSVTHWNTEKGEPMIIEERTMIFRRAPAPARLWVDFNTTLKAPNGDVMLDGDPEHAGVQFRPANEVVAKQTVYVFPKEKADARKDRDYPWVGETFVLKGQKHSVVDLNHPDNPKGTIFSAYRDYGRFGAFFKKPIKSGESLTLKYRFIIAEGEMLPTAFIQKAWDDYAGVTTPSPVPTITTSQSVKK